jgi:sialate O-acetylesterase
MLCLLLLCLLLLPALSRANVTLPALLTDNLVLQQKTTVSLWGWAAPGEALTVSASWLKATQQATADAQGNWLVRVPTAKAGGPYTISIEGQNKLVINNVLLGEVWLCSGQSNMNFLLAKGTAKWMTGEMQADSVLPTV